MDIASQLAGLSPAKRRIALEYLREHGAEFNTALLSSAQQRMWLLDQLHPCSATYNIFYAVEIQGELRIAALESAFSQLIDRHEALRTVVLDVDGTPLQVVLPASPFVMPITDLMHVRPEDRDTAAFDLAREETVRGFDLQRGPLMRISLLRLDAHRHIMLLTLHHIIADERSVRLIVRDVARAYTRLVNGEAQLQPVGPVLQYRDFAAWEKTREPAEVEQHLNYWTRKLSPLPPRLELPVDFVRQQSVHNGTHRVTALPQPLFQRLTGLARAHETTLFAVLLSAVYVLLERYTSQPDVVVGVPVAGRSRADFEEVVGLFANTLPVRVRIDGRERWIDLAKRVFDVMAEALEHQDTPFDRIVEAVGAPRQAEGSPLFDVLFVFHRAPAEPAGLTGLRLRTLPVVRPSARLDLSFLFEEGPNGLQMVIEYNRGLFRDESIEQMGRNLIALLENIANAPPTRVGELSLIDCMLPVSRQQAGNHDAAPLSLAAFEQRVRRHPDRIAVLSRGQASWTYAELDRDANRIAQKLIDGVVSTMVPVGVALVRSRTMVSALLAVWKVGGIYVPIDPAYPESRIRAMLEDSGAAVVLCDDTTSASIPSGNWSVVSVGGESAASQRVASVVLIPSQSAYIIFTSGSTGRPKGVVVSHGVLAQHIAAIRETYELAPDDCVLQFSSMSFDPSLEQILGALATGCSLFVRESELEAPAEFARTLAESGVTVINLPPSYWRRITAEWSAAGVELPAMKVRLVIVGGEVITADAVEQWRRTPLSRARLANAYGPTESVITSHVFTVPQETDGAFRVPIGFPQAGRCHYVVSANGTLLPPGVPGELYISGPCIADGYINDSTRTADAFVPNPFGGPPNDRLYRTGDIVRMLPSGALEYMGRRDNQVKLRGYRIELEEVRLALESHDAIRECAAVVREDTAGDRRLVAYYVASGSVPPEPYVLHAYLGTRLPSYMVPSAFVCVAALPLLPSGKLNVSALPAPARIAPRDHQTRTAPRTEAERQIATIWKSVLAAGEIAIEDNFFELGGDSILALQVVARANQVGLQLKVRQVFECQTVAALAAAAAPVTTASGLAHFTGPAPLTPVQQWFFRREWRNRNRFNQAIRVRVKSPVNVDRMARAVADCFARHDALRMRFRYENDQWIQQACSHEEHSVFARFEVADPTAAARICDQMQSSLDIEAGPMARFALLETTPEHRELLIVAHHLIIDAVSWRVLLADLERALNGADICAMPAPSFSAWADWWVRQARAAWIDEERQYWQSPPWSRVRPLPCDDDSGRGRNIIANACHFDIDWNSEVTTQLLQAGGSGDPHFAADALLAASAFAICEVTRSVALQIAVEGHGREAPGAPDISEAIGWFTAIYPILFEGAQSSTPESALEQIRAARRLLRHGGVSFGLLESIRPDALVRGAPDVSFNYLGQTSSALPHGGSFELGGDPGGTQQPDEKRTFLIDILARVDSGRLWMRWTYCPTVHRSDTVRAFAEVCRVALERIVAMYGKESVRLRRFSVSRTANKDLDALVARLEARAGGGKR